MNWIVGDVSGSTTLTDSDHLYATHIDQLRETYPYLAIVGTTPNCQYYCTGTADDVVIQAAINAVSNAGGGLVFIQAGTYNLSANNASPQPISGGTPYCSLILKSKVTLMGAGMFKTILNVPSFVTGLNSRLLAIVNNSAGDTDISVRDLSVTLPAFLSGAGGYWGTAVTTIGAKRTILRDLYLKNGAWNVLGYTKSFNSTTKELTSDCTECVIDNVITDQLLGSAQLSHAIHSSVSKCKFYGATDDAFIAVGSLQHCDFIENYFDGQNVTNGSSNAALYLANDGSVSTDVYAMSDIKIIGNTMRRERLNVGVTPSGIMFATCANIQIIGNTIENMIGKGIDNGGGTNCESIRIIGNTIRNNTGRGINIMNSGSNTAKHIEIIGNEIKNNGTYAIFINTTTSGSSYYGFTITGNEIYDDGTGTQTIGIQFASSGAGVDLSASLIASNNIHDTTTPINIGTGSGSTLSVNLRNNNGYVTENSGTATVLNGTTSIAVNHGLSRTPADGDIVVTPTNNMGTATKFFVNNYTSTQFTINVDQNPGASTATFLWKAQITRTAF